MTASAAAAAPTPARWRFTRRSAMDLAAIAALIAVSIIGFRPTFESPFFLVTGFAALAIGLGIATLAAALRWVR